MTTTINTQYSVRSEQSVIVKLFSQVLETEVTGHQALLLIHSFVAWVALMISACIHPVVAALMLVWFSSSVFQCYKSGLKIPKE